MTLQTFELADAGILLYDEYFLPPDVADRYFAELRDHSAWEQKLGVFGHMQPRLTASYGDDGITYRYSGTVNKGPPLDTGFVGHKSEDRSRPGKVQLLPFEPLQKRSRQHWDARR